MELVYFVVVGAVAGWLASTLMNMNASIIMTIVLGVVGGFIGGWGLGQIGIMLPWGMVGEIITAAIGAVVLIFLYKLVTK